MAKKIFAAIAIPLVLCFIIGAVLMNAIAPDVVDEPATKDENLTIFIDYDANKIVGCEAVAECTWKLSNGEYTVLYNDGSYKMLYVNNGGWTTN